MSSFWMTQNPPSLPWLTEMRHLSWKPLSRKERARPHLWLACSRKCPLLIFDAKTYTFSCDRANSLSDILSNNNARPCSGCIPSVLGTPPCVHTDGTVRSLTVFSTRRTPHRDRSKVSACGKISRGCVDILGVDPDASRRNLYYRQNQMDSPW